jgi:N-acyl-D-aspartate/D-glutamate deacylase
MPNPAPGNKRRLKSFKRMLGNYDLDERVLALEAAIRKIPSRRATRVGQADRDILRLEMIADVTVFEPVTIPRVATVDDPNRYSAGVTHPWRLISTESAGSRSSEAVFHRTKEDGILVGQQRAGERRRLRVGQPVEAGVERMTGASKNYRPNARAAYNGGRARADLHSVEPTTQPFLAARYPALTASTSVMYFPCLVLP